ncbi:hypothetical protein [Bradyrhizobium sp. USDA 10063]
MRVAINAVDDMMFVGQEPHTVDCVRLRAEKIDAVQWHDDWGEIEFATDWKAVPQYRPPNERITDFSKFMPYIEQWRKQKAIDDKKEKEIQDKIEADWRIAQENLAAADKYMEESKAAAEIEIAKFKAEAEAEVKAKAELIAKVAALEAKVAALEARER